MLKTEDRIFKNLYNELGWEIDSAIKRVEFGLIPTDPIDAATKQQTIVPNIPSDILNQGNFQDFSWLDLKRDS